MKKLLAALAVAFIVTLTCVQAATDEYPRYAIKVDYFVDFGTAYFGFERAVIRTVVVTNVGNATIPWLSVFRPWPGQDSFSGAYWHVLEHNTDEKIFGQHIFAEALAPGDYAKFDILFLPTQWFMPFSYRSIIVSIRGPGDIFVRLETWFHSINPPSNPATLSADITPTHTDFGTIFVCTEQPEATFSITNTGNVDIRTLRLLTNAQAAYTNRHPFIASIEWEGVDIPPLPPGETMDAHFSINFAAENMPLGAHSITFYLFARRGALDVRQWHEHILLGTIEVTFTAVAPRPVLLPRWRRGY